MITIKQIEAFYWASTLGSFEAGAGKLNIAQSTISKRIQELEHQSRVLLFDRSRRTVRLTMKGQEMLAYARDLLESTRRINCALGQSETYAGRFRLGVTELVSLTWLPRLVAEIQSRYRSLTLEFEVDLAVPLFKKLAEGSIDLVIASSVHDQPEFEIYPLDSVEISWMCGRTLDAPARPSVAEIAVYPVLMQSGGSALQSMIARQLADPRVPVSQVISCNSMLGLAELAASGLGVTCLPRLYFAGYLESGALRVIDADPPIPDLPFAVFHRPDGVDICPEIAAMAGRTCDFSRPSHAARSVEPVCAAVPAYPAAACGA